QRGEAVGPPRPGGCPVGVSPTCERGTRSRLPAGCRRYFRPVQCVVSPDLPGSLGFAGSAGFGLSAGLSLSAAFFAHFARVSRNGYAPCGASTLPVSDVRKGTIRP